MGLKLGVDQTFQCANEVGVCLTFEEGDCMFGTIHDINSPPVFQLVGELLVQGANGAHEFTVLQEAISGFVVPPEQNVHIVKREGESQAERACSPQELLLAAVALSLFIENDEGIHEIEIRHLGQLHLDGFQLAGQVHELEQSLHKHGVFHGAQHRVKWPGLA